MVTESQRIAIRVWVWSVAALVALVMLQAVNIEYYIVLLLIGLLIIAELSTSFKFWPKWKIKVYVVLAAGMLIFVIVVLVKTLEILNR